MMKEQNLPILIIGAGLAGICLADQLYKRNISFTVIDDGQNRSTRIAAGIINPLVFRRTTKSWRIDEFLPETLRFFNEKSSEWGQTYFTPVPIRRAFSHLQEKEDWLKKQEQEDFSPYMKKISEEDDTYSSVINTCGTAQVLQSGYIQTQSFLEDAHTWLKSINAFREEHFEYQDLDPSAGTYKQEAFAEIVFCEGYSGIYNPWFSYLPLEATKGEILTVRSEHIPEDESLNRKCFVLPVGNHSFKVGATYTWRTDDTLLTQEAKQQLTDDLTGLTSAPFEITDHQAGIRPTVIDRRPLLGRHYQYPKLSIMNGLGAKGFLMAPSIAKELADFLLYNSPLDKETDIQRYKKLIP